MGTNWIVSFMVGWVRSGGAVGGTGETLPREGRQRRGPSASRTADGTIAVREYAAFSGKIQAGTRRNVATVQYPPGKKLQESPHSVCSHPQYGCRLVVEGDVALLSRPDSNKHSREPQMKRSNRVLVYDRCGDSHDNTNGRYVSRENTEWFKDGVAEGRRQERERQERERQERERQQRLLEFKLMSQRHGISTADGVLDPFGGGLRKTIRPTPNATGAGRASRLVSVLHLLGLKKPA
jgi:hypothetical protein